MNKEDRERHDRLELESDAKPETEEKEKNKDLEEWVRDIYLFFDDEDPEDKKYGALTNLLGTLKKRNEELPPLSRKVRLAIESFIISYGIMMLGFFILFRLFESRQSMAPAMIPLYGGLMLWAMSYSASMDFTRDWWRARSKSYEEIKKLCEILGVPAEFGLIKKIDQLVKKIDLEEQDRYPETQNDLLDAAGEVISTLPNAEEKRRRSHQ